MEPPQYGELRSLILDSSAAFIVPTFSCAFLIKASFVLLDFSDLQLNRSRSSFGLTSRISCSRVTSPTFWRRSTALRTRSRPRLARNALILRTRTAASSNRRYHGAAGLNRRPPRHRPPTRFRTAWYQLSNRGMRLPSRSRLGSERRRRPHRSAVSPRPSVRQKWRMRSRRARWLPLRQARRSGRLCHCPGTFIRHRLGLSLTLIQV
jgi:hypothetical protein